jgi:hypothetical protein
MAATGKQHHAQLLGLTKAAALGRNRLDAASCSQASTRNNLAACAGPIR